MAYDPSDHATLLFGGYVLTSGYHLSPHDTWEFAGNTWTEIISNSSCTPSTCPSPRYGAMMAYDAPLGAVVLFGGAVSFIGGISTLNDTWLFYQGAWHNITSSAGAAPSPRFRGAMTWDTYDNYVLLFGGATGNGNTLNDTWTFAGHWKDISKTAGVPIGGSRAGAAISDSPSGYILMFGGESFVNSVGGILQGTTEVVCPFYSNIASWFFNGTWRGIPVSLCVHVASNSTSPAPLTPYVSGVPCGRVDGALGWSPKNERFVLYGGEGPVDENNQSCGNPYDTWYNDTWTYEPSPGANSSLDEYLWNYAGDSGDPYNRSGMAYATDYTDGYFIIFGGPDESKTLDYASDETWRFYEIVHAELTGPSAIDTNTSNTGLAVPFTVHGYGGTGTLGYAFGSSLQKVRNGNSMTDSGSTSCAVLANTSGGSGVYGPLPYDGIATYQCLPTPSSYNVYRLTVHIWDENNVTDSAYANWTFTVNPPEFIAIHSQYTGYFYSGISPFPNNFGVYATLGGGNATGLTATLAGITVPFTQRSGANEWWDASPDMGTLPYGAQALRVTASFPGWTLNASYPVNIVETPDWLISVVHYQGVTQTISSKGSGPWNESYSITEAFEWSLDKALGFNIELPFVKGNVSLIPGIKVSLTATSSGNLSLTGALSLTPPSIDLGPAKLKISVTASLKGTFTLSTSAGQVTGITWVSAIASITLSGEFSGDVPIYGFNILGVQVGFTLHIEVDPSITLGVLLAPTTPGFEEFIPGIQVKIQQFVGSFSLALTLAVVFGIGIASIGIGGTLSVALNFATNTGLYIPAGWVNGTIFVEASFLCWSDEWDLASGVIYNWTSPPPSIARPDGSPFSPSGYNNGTNTKWGYQTRYYVTSGYDQNVWNANLTEGPAVSDIYPRTEVSGTAAYNGGYLFYSDDNAQLPVQQGSRVSGLRLDPSTNRLTALPSPTDPGFVLTHPEATTLPDGSLYVVWDAVPESAASLSSPMNLTSVPLHGARFYPGNLTWGPITTWTSGGIAQAFGLDGSSAPGTLAVLVGPSFLVGGSTPERLVEFDLTSGREVSNLSVTGLSEIASVNGALGEAVVEQVGGNYSVVNLATGAAVPVSVALPSGSHLISESFVPGSAATLALLFRTPTSTDIVLYDLRAAQVVANLTTDPSASTVEALYGNGTYYLFEQVATGIAAWTESAGAFSALPEITEPNLESFGVVQVGTSILVDSLVASASTPNPIVSLDLTEIGSTLPAVSPPSSSPPPPSGTQNTTGGSSAASPNYPLYLGAAAGGVAVLLAVIAIVGRRSPPTRGPTPPRPEPDPSNPSGADTEEPAPAGARPP